MDVPDIEGRLPGSFTQLYSVIGKILRDNHIMPVEEEAKKDINEFLIQEKNQEISNLKSEMKAKENQIHVLKQKEGLL
jgi:hypothetical protein